MFWNYFRKWFLRSLVFFILIFHIENGFTYLDLQFKLMQFPTVDANWSQEEWNKYDEYAKVSEGLGWKYDYNIPLRKYIKQELVNSLIHSIIKTIIIAAIISSVFTLFKLLASRNKIKDNI